MSIVLGNKTFFFGLLASQSVAIFLFHNYHAADRLLARILSQNAVNLRNLNYDASGQPTRALFWSPVSVNLLAWQLKITAITMNFHHRSAMALG